MSKAAFKDFVAKNPVLASKVNSGKTSWQKLYEMYDIYKEDETVWAEYLKEEKKVDKTNGSNLDILGNYFKSIDTKQLQSGISSVQKVLGLVSDIFVKEGTKIETPGTSSSYVPRAINKRFDD